MAIQGLSPIYTAPVRRINGFDASRCASIQLDQDNMKSLGITPDDWEKADKDGDGLITWSEFCNGGMGISSIFNAFVQSARNINKDAYIAETQTADNTSQIQKKQNTVTNPFLTQKYSPAHPSYENHPFLAQNTDYVA